MATNRKETQPKQRPQRRKLLVATVGLAAVSYIAVAEACGGKTDGDPSSSGGNSSSSGSTGKNPVSGNLVAPTNTPTNPPISGNLPSPPPIEAGTDASRDGAVKDASNDQN
jgi:hypothetical protein